MFLIMLFTDYSEATRKYYQYIRGMTLCMQFFGSLAHIVAVNYSVSREYHIEDCNDRARGTYSEADYKFW